MWNEDKPIVIENENCKMNYFLQGSNQDNEGKHWNHTEATKRF